MCAAALMFRSSPRAKGAHIMSIRNWLIEGTALVSAALLLNVTTVAAAPQAGAQKRPPATPPVARPGPIDTRGHVDRRDQDEAGRPHLKDRDSAPAHHRHQSGGRDND
jgi:hypothetical protein